ncbi:MAG: hypothetical protein CSA07_03325 [Bacteroidia bacterium]|nr:MAG: hypothetical protein CSA07_03325 [Bacteroidia bacterium]
MAKCIKTFLISVGQAEEENQLNLFLEGHRVLALERHFVDLGGQPSWALLVVYDALPATSAGSSAPRGNRTPRVDYKEVLPPEIFAVYEQLRSCRKQISEADGVAVYNIFVNEELAAMAALPQLDLASIQATEGVQKGRAEKYGQRLLELYQAQQQHEAQRPAHGADSPAGKSTPSLLEG